MQTKINLTRCGTQIKAFSFHTKLDYWQLTVIIYLFMYEIKILNQCLNIGCWQKVSPKSHQFSLSQHPLVINALFLFSPMSALSSMNHTWMTEIKPWAKMKVKPWWHWVSLQVMGKNPGQYATTSVCIPLIFVVTSLKTIKLHKVLWCGIYKGFHIHYKGLQLKINFRMCKVWLRQLVDRWCRSSCDHHCMCFATSVLISSLWSLQSCSHASTQRRIDNRQHGAHHRQMALCYRTGLWIANISRRQGKNVHKTFGRYNEHWPFSLQIWVSVFSDR